MSMAMDKGEVPAKGSWWRVNLCGCEFVATGEPAGFYNASKVEGPSKCKRDTNLSHYIYPPACTLLAPSPSSPGRPAPAKGQRWRIPSGMYAGDIELTEVQGKDCFRFKWTSGDRAGRSDGADMKWLEIWKAEFVDGPRSTQGESRADPPSPYSCDECGRSLEPGDSLRNGVCQRCRAPVVTSKPVYGRMVGEMRGPDGTPLTALQHIQARQPPEPWRPSVDEYDLLPDAGTSWSYSKPSSPGEGE